MDKQKEYKRFDLYTDFFIIVTYQTNEDHFGKHFVQWDKDSVTFLEYTAHVEYAVGHTTWNIEDIITCNIQAPITYMYPVHIGN